MKNTLAIGVILLGSIMVMASVKNWKMVTAIQVITGQKPWDTPADGGGASGSSSGNPFDRTVPGNATPNEKDRPGYTDDQLEKNPDGTWKRDANGYIVIKPGEEGHPKVGTTTAQRGGASTPKQPVSVQNNDQVRRNLARF